MKVYISGEITNNSNYKKDFAIAEKSLKEQGYKVFNPARKQYKSWTWEDYMRRDIKQLMECDAILLLDNWQKSKGARLEAIIARELKLKIISSETTHAIDFF